MPIVPRIYTWRRELVPTDQVFMAGGTSVDGGMTLGGALVQSPEPGGRATLIMGFGLLARRANLAASWTYSRAMNGAVFSIPIRCTDQLVDRKGLLPPATDGIPWSEGQPWGNGENWGWNPTAPLVASAGRGTVEVVTDLSAYGPVLQVGHVIGFSVDGVDSAHIVMDIDYDGDTATIAIQPPLRRAVTEDVRLRFRPSMLATCRNPAEFAAPFGLGRFTRPGSARFVEALI
ncbi:hypothetical protein [Oceaniglobus trochenteri]|uniref:hypothetical protein n=1 Tax=Oceaniglobus trochenteri TaxID=2763260 RepID=UPI001CFF79E8|nr:hypothetical protein [Oceaniglobus trochenteri]